MPVIDSCLRWSKAEILVSLGKGRTFAGFQILGTFWVTKESFKAGFAVSAFSLLLFKMNPRQEYIFKAFFLQPIE